MAHFCQTIFWPTILSALIWTCGMAFIHILYGRTLGPFLPNYFLADDLGRLKRRIAWRVFT
ncbi:MAG: hypothetical protein DRR08_15895 [Candidatus Parabeggiatoa sp. nov. 2]|nr:MAG: hypothetical protein B6247_25215 [Beggiatoa sp. 4572_84]RKZ58649.1 MAG: hypothetical protein DRR08_15895 [Gammaproteobacteria bacterium]